jgi:cytochrome c1
MRRAKLLILLSVSVLALSACRDGNRAEAQRLTGGNFEAGRLAIERHGCGACHIIPGIRGAKSLVGPSLQHVGNRTYVAGVLRNTPANMARWIQDPRAIDPLTAMPSVGVTDSESTDIVTYLYTLQ